MSFFEYFKPRSEKVAPPPQEKGLNDTANGVAGEAPILDTDERDQAELERAIHEESMHEKMQQANELERPVD